MNLTLRSMLLNLRFYMNLTLRSLTSPCSSPWTWCCAPWSSIDVLHDIDANAPRSSLAVPHGLDAALMIVSCNSTWTWRCVPCFSFAVLHELDATLLDLPLQFSMNLMLRSVIFTGSSAWTWCYALRFSVAVLQELDATLRDVHLQFYMNWMPRSVIFTGSSAWPRCRAPWLSLAVYSKLGDLHGSSTWTWCCAVFWRGLLHAFALLFARHMHVCRCFMLCSMIFIGVSTKTWCYTHDLHLCFYKFLMPRSMILTCMSKWTSCYALPSSTDDLAGRTIQPNNLATGLNRTHLTNKNKWTNRTSKAQPNQLGHQGQQGQQDQRKTTNRF